MNWLDKTGFDRIPSLRKWWKDRQPREQMLLGVCLVFLIGYGCYSLYQAVQSHLEELNSELEQSQLDLIWLAEKRIDILRLAQQGGIELNEQEVRQVIESALVNEDVVAQSTIRSLDQGWVVDWQGSNPSNVMKAISRMALAGAIVKHFNLSRTDSNAKISVTLTNL